MRIVISLVTLFSFVFNLCAQQVTEERVAIKNGKHTIDGLLILPENTQEPVPAIIFLGGSGGWEIVDSYLRDPSKSYANFLSFYLEDYIRQNQVAFLYLNKRGFGKSTGKYGRADLVDRASDANAAFQFLKTYSRIDASKIGMIGHSQGGWVAQIAAAQNADIAFVVSFAGPTVGVKQQTYTDYANQFDCQYGKGSIKSKRALKKKKIELGVGSVIGKLIGGSAAEYARMVRYKNDQTLRSINIPTLLLFGGNDLIVPAKENIDYLNQVFNGAVPKNFTVWTGPNLNHAFHEVPNGCMDYLESLALPESRDLQQFLQNWLSSVFNARKI